MNHIGIREWYEHNNNNNNLIVTRTHTHTFGFDEIPRNLLESEEQIMTLLWII